MEIITGNLHDPLTATYQTLELARLNETLKDCGVKDVKLRRVICEKYFFNAGYFLDSGWLPEQERRFRPGVHFVEIKSHKEAPLALLLPDPEVGTMFHEYAHGAAAWLFDDHDEEASEIKTGDVNEA